MYKQNLADDYWAFHAAHSLQPCKQCTRQHRKEMEHWLGEGHSEGKYAFLRARIQEVLRHASPIDRERLCIEHIQREEDVYKLRDWFYHHNLEPHSPLVELAFLDQLMAIWNKTKPV